MQNGVLTRAADLGNSTVEGCHQIAQHGDQFDSIIAATNGSGRLNIDDVDHWRARWMLSAIVCDGP